MSKIRSSSLVAMAFVAILAVPAAAAQSGAPDYVSSEPGDGEEVHRAPDRVEVIFDEPLDQASGLTVTDSCGRTVDDGDVTIQANTMSVGLELKPSGHYEVDYLARGIAGLTGETKGDFHFMVHMGKACSRAGGGRGARKAGDGGRQGGSGGSGRSSTDHGSGGGSVAPSAAAYSGTSNYDSMGRDRTDPSKAGGKQGKGRGQGKDVGKGRGSRGTADTAAPSDGVGTLAAGEGGPAGAPDGPAIVTALGLSLVLGVVGGWFLRVSGAR